VSSEVGKARPLFTPIPLPPVPHWQCGDFATGGFWCSRSPTAGAQYVVPSGLVAGEDVQARGGEKGGEGGEWLA